MAIPTECKMPDLSSLKPLLNTLFLQVFRGERGLSQKARRYRSNFVRLVDKALREYREARQCILAQIAEANRSPKDMAREGRIIYMVEFTNHIETCINAVSRLFRLLDRIKSEKESPTFPRELRRLVETKSEPVTNVRNAVEHIDEYIQKDEIAPGQPIMLALIKNDDGVAVLNYEIKFKELAMVLENMYEIAQYILTVKKIKVKPLV